MDRLGLAAARIPIDGAGMPEVSAPYVLVCPTYSDHEGRGAVPKQVISFLNDPQRRGLMRGVIAGGNRNFGPTFALAGTVISEKCGVPVLYRFELAGTERDIENTRAGLSAFWQRLDAAAA